jgi:hypothetical protein
VLNGSMVYLGNGGGARGLSSFGWKDTEVPHILVEKSDSPL